MHSWAMFWYKAGLTIGGVLVTGRAVAHRLPALPVGACRLRPPLVGGRSRYGAQNGGISGPSRLR